MRSIKITSPKAELINLLFLAHLGEAYTLLLATSNNFAEVEELRLVEGGDLVRLEHLFLMLTVLTFCAGGWPKSSPIWILVSKEAELLIFVHDHRLIGVK